MMKKLILFIIVAISISQFGCRERNELINLTEDLEDTTISSVDPTLKDTTYIDDTTRQVQEKIVLIDDVTGVRCPNCPAAQKEADKIVQQHPGQVILVAIHPEGSSLTIPYPESKYDFRTQDGSNLFNFLGPDNLPAGSVDRMKFTGENLALTYYTKWESYVSQRLSIPPPVNIEILKADYDEALKKLLISVKFTYTEEVNTANYFSLMLTESGLVDYQVDGQTKIPEYTHDHILRDIIPEYNGRLLAGNMEKGRVYVRSFAASVPDEWKPDHMHVVALVHERGDKEMKVLQVQETNVK